MFFQLLIDNFCVTEP